MALNEVQLGLVKVFVHVFMWESEVAHFHTETTIMQFLYL